MADIGNYIRSLSLIRRGYTPDQAAQITRNEDLEKYANYSPTQKQQISDYYSAKVFGVNPTKVTTASTARNTSPSVNVAQAMAPQPSPSAMIQGPKKIGLQPTAPTKPAFQNISPEIRQKVETGTSIGGEEFTQILQAGFSPEVKMREEKIKSMTGLTQAQLRNEGMASISYPKPKSLDLPKPALNYANLNPKDIDEIYNELSKNLYNSLSYGDLKVLDKTKFTEFLSPNTKLTDLVGTTTNLLQPIQSRLDLLSKELQKKEGFSINEATSSRINKIKQEQANLTSVKENIDELFGNVVADRVNGIVFKKLVELQKSGINRSWDVNNPFGLYKDFVGMGVDEVVSLMNYTKMRDSKGKYTNQGVLFRELINSKTKVEAYEKDLFSFQLSPQIADYNTSLYKLKSSMMNYGLERLASIDKEAKKIKEEFDNLPDSKKTKEKVDEVNNRLKSFESEQSNSIKVIQNLEEKDFNFNSDLARKDWRVDLFNTEVEAQSAGQLEYDTSGKAGHIWMGIKRAIKSEIGAATESELNYYTRIKRMFDGFAKSSGIPKLTGEDREAWRKSATTQLAVDNAYGLFKSAIKLDSYPIMDAIASSAAGRPVSASQFLYFDKEGGWNFGGGFLLEGPKIITDMAKVILVTRGATSLAGGAIQSMRAGITTERLAAASVKEAARLERIVEASKVGGSSNVWSAFIRAEAGAANSQAAKMFIGALETRLPTFVSTVATTYPSIYRATLKELYRNRVDDADSKAKVIAGWNALIEGATEGFIGVPDVARAFPYLGDLARTSNLGRIISKFGGKKIQSIGDYRALLDIFPNLSSNAKGVLAKVAYSAYKGGKTAVKTGVSFEEGFEEAVAELGNHLVSLAYEGQTGIKAEELNFESVLNAFVGGAFLTAPAVLLGNPAAFAQYYKEDEMQSAFRVALNADLFKSKIYQMQKDGKISQEDAVKALAKTQLFQEIVKDGTFGNLVTDAEFMQDRDAQYMYFRSVLNSKGVEQKLLEIGENAPSEQLRTHLLKIAEEANKDIQNFQRRSSIYSNMTDEQKKEHLLKRVNKEAENFPYISLKQLLEAHKAQERQKGIAKVNSKAVFPLIGDVMDTRLAKLEEQITARRKAVNDSVDAGELNPLMVNTYEVEEESGRLDESNLVVDTPQDVADMLLQMALNPDTESEIPELFEKLITIARKEETKQKIFSDYIAQARERYENPNLTEADLSAEELDELKGLLDNHSKIIDVAEQELEALQEALVSKFSASIQQGKFTREDLLEELFGNASTTFWNYGYFRQMRTRLTHEQMVNFPAFQRFLEDTAQERLDFVTQAMQNEQDIAKEEQAAQPTAEVSEKPAEETEPELNKDLKPGKIEGTDYEVKEDGVYWKGTKLQNPNNLSNYDLVKDHIAQRERLDFLTKNDGKMVVINSQTGLLTKVNNFRYELETEDAIYEYQFQDITSVEAYVSPEEREAEAQRMAAEAIRQQKDAERQAEKERYEVSEVSETEVTVNGVEYQINVDALGNVESLSPKNNPKQKIKNERLLINVEIARNQSAYNSLSEQKASAQVEALRTNHPNLSRLLTSIWEFNFTDSVGDALDRLYDGQELTELESLQVAIWLSDVFDRIAKLIDRQNTKEENDLILQAYNTAEIINSLLYKLNNVTVNQDESPEKTAQSIDQVESNVNTKKSAEEVKSRKKKTKEASTKKPAEKNTFTKETDALEKAATIQDMITGAELSLARTAGLTGFTAKIQEAALKVFQGIQQSRPQLESANLTSLVKYVLDAPTRKEAVARALFVASIYNQDTSELEQLLTQLFDAPSSSFTNAELVEGLKQTKIGIRLIGNQAKLLSFEPVEPIGPEPEIKEPEPETVASVAPNTASNLKHGQTYAISYSNKDLVDTSKNFQFAVRAQKIMRTILGLGPTKVKVRVMDLFSFLKEYLPDGESRIARMREIYSEYRNPDITPEEKSALREELISLFPAGLLKPTMITYHVDKVMLGTTHGLIDEAANTRFEDTNIILGVGVSLNSQGKYEALKFDNEGVLSESGDGMFILTFARDLSRDDMRRSAIEANKIRRHVNGRGSVDALTEIVNFYDYVYSTDQSVGVAIQQSPIDDVMRVQQAIAPTPKVQEAPVPAAPVQPSNIEADIERGRQEKLNKSGRIGNLDVKSFFTSVVIKKLSSELIFSKVLKTTDFNHFLNSIKTTEGIDLRNDIKKEGASQSVEEFEKAKVAFELQAKKIFEEINAEYDAKYVEAVKKGEMTKEQAMEALEKAGRKESAAYAELAAQQPAIQLSATQAKIADIERRRQEAKNSIKFRPQLEEALLRDKKELERTGRVDNRASSALRQLIKNKEDKVDKEFDDIILKEFGELEYKKTKILRDKKNLEEYFSKSPTTDYLELENRKKRLAKYDEELDALESQAEPSVEPTPQVPPTAPEAPVSKVEEAPVPAKPKITVATSPEFSLAAISQHIKESETIAEPSKGGYQIGGLLFLRQSRYNAMFGKAKEEEVEETDLLTASVVTGDFVDFLGRDILAGKRPLTKEQYIEAVKAKQGFTGEVTISDEVFMQLLTDFTNFRSKIVSEGGHIFTDPMVFYSKFVNEKGEPTPRIIDGIEYHGVAGVPDIIVMLKDGTVHMVDLKNIKFAKKEDASEKFEARRKKWQIQQTTYTVLAKGLIPKIETTNILGVQSSYLAEQGNVKITQLKLVDVEADVPENSGNPSIPYVYRLNVSATDAILRQRELEARNHLNFVSNSNDTANKNNECNGV